jgi:hypothetical protein
MNATGGYVKRRGMEYPSEGASAIRVWIETENGSLQEWDLRDAPILLMLLAA